MFLLFFCHLNSHDSIIASEALLCLFHVQLIVFILLPVAAAPPTLPRFLLDPVSTSIYKQHLDSTMP